MFYGSFGNYYLELINCFVNSGVKKEKVVVQMQ